MRGRRNEKPNRTEKAERNERTEAAEKDKIAAGASETAGKTVRPEWKKSSSLLRHPVFGRTFSAYSISVFGDWFDIIAIQVLIGYRWQASPLEIALVPVCMAVPGILLGSAAGAAADRVNRLKLMRVCDLLTALTTVAILLVPGIGWLLPLLALRAALGVFNMPAQQALTRRVVSEEQLLDASSLNGLVSQLSRIAGPLLGASLLSVLSPQACILVNAVARLVSYGILRTVSKDVDAERLGKLKGEAESGAKAKRTPFSVMLREGWIFVRRTPILMNLLLFALVGMIVIQAIDFQFISLFREIAPDSETAIGWLLAASGASAAGVAVANMRFRPLRQAEYALKLGLSYGLLGLSILLLALLPVGASGILIIGIGLLLGAGNGLFLVTFNYALQRETPSGMTGRVFGIQNTALSAVMVAAPPLGGVLIERFGLSAVFAGAGLTVLLLGAAGFAFGRLWWPGASIEAVDVQK
ncbi:MFS transporter [Saccharibacillus kuerlensis]|uniref:MFS transporter n=1 Tax=Saccharibacillus kuerlensis TaxID=459527 RepID=A0ABQ2KUJ5_9BACL|nr:MFS transporter [Saccharibacillus kuerlensis]GGN93789.1 MFS transporter [Saccharibacillus kuerlensis]